jgi:hypothetical protein
MKVIASVEMDVNVVPNGASETQIAESIADAVKNAIDAAYLDGFEYRGQAALYFEPLSVKVGDVVLPIKLRG